MRSTVTRSAVADPAVTGTHTNPRRRQPDWRNRRWRSGRSPPGSLPAPAQVHRMRYAALRPSRRSSCRRATSCRRRSPRASARGCRQVHDEDAAREAPAGRRGCLGAPPGVGRRERGRARRCGRPSVAARARGGRRPRRADSRPPTSADVDRSARARPRPAAAFAEVAARSGRDAGPDKLVGDDAVLIYPPVDCPARDRAAAVAHFARCAGPADTSAVHDGEEDAVVVSRARRVARSRTRLLRIGRAVNEHACDRRCEYGCAGELEPHSRATAATALIAASTSSSVFATLGPKRT